MLSEPDELTEKREVIRFITDSIHHDSANPRVLELGSGQGKIWGLFPKLKPYVIYTDLLPHALPKEGTRTALNAQEIPLREGIFSHVLASGVVDLTIKPKTLSEVARVLRPGGQGIFVFDHPQSAYISGFEKERQFYQYATRAINKITKGIDPANELHLMTAHINDLFPTTTSNGKPVEGLTAKEVKKKLHELTEKVDELNSRDSLLTLALTIRRLQIGLSQVEERETAMDTARQVSGVVTSKFRTLSRMSGPQSKVYSSRAQIIRELARQGFQRGSIKVELLEDETKGTPIGWGVTATKKYSVDWSKGRIR